MTNKVKIITAQEVLPPLEILAEHIEAVAKLGQEIKNSRLTEQAILVLLKHKTFLPMNRIKEILDSLAELKDYVKPINKTKGKRDE